jgi:hypothetical protein
MLFSASSTASVWQLLVNKAFMVATRADPFWSQTPSGHKA